MGDYKNSIFLPKTSFAMKGNLAVLEPSLLDRWDKQNLYKTLREQSRGRQKFILHWGPPYANGDLHLGHVLSEVLKDILNRSMQMLGYDAPLVPGWDCHGLPIEWKVEENYRAQGQAKNQVSHRAFRQACRDFASKWVPIQKQQFQRLGILADWQHPYLTMDYTAEASTLGELFKMLESGAVYKGVRPVMWSVVERTALAEAEVEYEDHTSSSIYVLFPLKGKIDGTALPSFLKEANILIWTTTPWSLPGNRAVCFNPTFEYALVKTQAWGKLLIAKDLIEKVLSVLAISSYEIIEVFQGNILQGLYCEHPLATAGYTFDVPLLPGEHVTLEAGTGLVHTAPCHGPEDFEVGKRFHLEIPEPIGEDGYFHPDFPLVAGQHVFKVDSLLIKALQEEGRLAHHSQYTHSYPHSWRSKAPLIYRATAQWFVSMDANDLRQKALAAIDNVDWFPATSKNRIKGMIKNRPDWCLSRQRAWGVPIAFFVNKLTGQPLIDKAVNQRILSIIRAEGCDAWFESPKERFLGPDYDANDFEQGRDILDVWFDSGASQAFVLEERDELQCPADVYLEGSDQHRGWFQSSLLIGCANREGAPFKKVITHGFCLDSQGRKFSKSLGNGISPQEVISSLGAEILRLWVVSCDYTDDVRIGSEILKHQQDIYRRFRNTLRYLLGALSDPTIPTTCKVDSLPDLERFILHRLTELHEEHTQALKDANFQSFYGSLHTFCSQDLSAFYFDIRKDTLYCEGLNHPSRQASLYIMDQVFHFLVHWLAPVLCFTAEEAWLARHTEEVPSIHLSAFPTPNLDWRADDIAGRIQHLRTLRRVMTSALEEARASGLIGSSLGAHLHIYDPEGLVPPKALLEELAIVSKVIYHSASFEGAQYKLDKGTLILKVTEASGKKCERCWKVLEEVKEELCTRCERVIGEKR